MFYTYNKTAMFMLYKVYSNYKKENVDGVIIDSLKLQPYYYYSHFKTILNCLHELEP